MISERRKLLFDLFTTACEGGINYWADVDAYHLWLPDSEYDPDYNGFYADLTDHVDDERPNPLHVDRLVMSSGLTLASRAWRHKVSWSTAPPPVAITAEARDRWDFDAGDADVILQLGLFKDVVYG